MFLLLTHHRWCLFFVFPEDGVICIVLVKGNRGVTWPSVLQDEPQSDALSVEGDKQQALLQRFQEEVRVLCCVAGLDAHAPAFLYFLLLSSQHPGFDFSGAEFNGQAPEANKFMDGFA
jgi:hypothetical protein